MDSVKIVVGANYGDEGKGLVTDYLTRKAIEEGNHVLVVLHNGGPQRAHTVETPNGFRHVFKHVGAGTLAGADTLITDNFLVNPMELRREIEALDTVCKFPFRIWISSGCIMTTHLDMMANQIREEIRGENRFGSCGMGIWETLLRKKFVESLYMRSTADELLETFNSIRKYYYNIRMEDLTIPEKWKPLFDSTEMDLRYTEDLLWCLNNPHIVPAWNTKGYIPSNDMSGSYSFERWLLNHYETIIFEGGQGMAIDGKLEKNYNHNTPSNTDSSNPIEILKMFNYHEKLFHGNKEWHEPEIETCYVSRTYLTRHGAGGFPGECSWEDLNPKISIFDKTNVENQFQGKLRYAPLNLNDLQKRITTDLRRYERNKVNTSSRIFFTHQDEIPLQSILSSGKIDWVNKIDLSLSPTRAEVHDIRE